MGPATSAVRASAVDSSSGESQTLRSLQSLAPLALREGINSRRSAGIWAINAHCMFPEPGTPVGISYTTAAVELLPRRKGTWPCIPVGPKLEASTQSFRPGSDTADRPNPKLLNGNRKYCNVLIPNGRGRRSGGWSRTETLRNCFVGMTTVWWLIPMGHWLAGDLIHHLPRPCSFGKCCLVDWTRWHVL